MSDSTNVVLLNGTNSSSLTHGMTPSQIAQLGLNQPMRATRQQSHSPAPSPDSDSAPLPQQNVLTHFLMQRLMSTDRVERHFNFLLAMLVGSSVLFALLKTEGPIFLWGSPICSLWATALIFVTLTNVWAEQRQRWVIFEVARFAQFLLCMLAVLIYYDGSNVINRYRYATRGAAMLWDESLLMLDEMLFGWLWPRGQMALWLDTQPTFGATTPIGRLYAEVFQILYVSYYFWGNAIGVILAFKYFYYAVYKKAKGAQKRLQWRRIQMFVSAWVGAFVFNHLINLCFPAVSPRIYLADQYVNPIEGVWLLSGMRNAITNAAANTFSAFPSGHCGLSILAVLLAYRVNLSRAYTGAVAISTVLIVLATQVLRYHYFVDFLFSITVVLFGTWLGGFHPRSLYKRSLIDQGLEDLDEEGKYLGNGNGNARESVPLMSIRVEGDDDDEDDEDEIALSSPPSKSGRLTREENGSNSNSMDGMSSGEKGRENGREGGGSPLVLSSTVFGMGLNRSQSSQKLGGGGGGGDDAV